MASSRTAPVPLSSGFIASLKRLIPVPIKSILLSGKRSGRQLPNGPWVLQENLRAGLARLGQSYRWDPEENELTGRVHVVSRPDALRWAIEQKRRGKIDFLMAGPNIVRLPWEYEGLIARPEVDCVICASEWVARMFEDMVPSLAGRIRVWYSGVNSEYWRPAKPASERHYDYLILDKINAAFWSGEIEPEHRTLGTAIQERLTKMNARFVYVEYGTYRPEEYLNLLQESRALIYLTRQETQGLAAMEAWFCDVPTMVWDRGYCTSVGCRWDGASSCPYLTPETGMPFRDGADFDRRIGEFAERLQAGMYHPRERAMGTFTIERAARVYLELWESLMGKRNGLASLEETQ